ncbi:hypothetical protein [Blastomonas sp.]|uniref:hypothetical protein n=1 Tax=Blastomonas sp. TaxID=1909299 RepID=UPI003593819C
MVWVIRLLVLLFGLAFVFLGARGMLDPMFFTQQFELGRQGATGQSALRADFGAFFIGTGLAALAGLVPGQRHWLLGAATMVALAFFGRAIGLASAGMTSNIANAMLVEAISVALLVAGYTLLRPMPKTEPKVEPEPYIAPQTDPDDQSFGDPQRDSDLRGPIG